MCRPRPRGEDISHLPSQPENSKDGSACRGAPRMGEGEASWVRRGRWATEKGSVASRSRAGAEVVGAHGAPTGEPITCVRTCVHRARPWSHKLWDPHALACIPQPPWGSRASLAFLLPLSSAARAFQCFPQLSSVNS